MTVVTFFFFFFSLNFLISFSEKKKKKHFRFVHFDHIYVNIYSDVLNGIFDKCLSVIY